MALLDDPDEFAARFDLGGEGFFEHLDHGGVGGVLVDVFEGAVVGVEDSFGGTGVLLHPGEDGVVGLELDHVGFDFGDVGVGGGAASRGR